MKFTQNQLQFIKKLSISSSANNTTTCSGIPCSKCCLSICCQGCLVGCEQKNNKKYDFLHVEGCIKVLHDHKLEMIREILQ